MQNSDWLMKVLVALLVVATWGLLLRSFFPVSSQSATKALIVCAVDDTGNYYFDGRGNSIGLTAVGLTEALEAAGRHGKIVHSVLPLSGSAGYVLIVEK